MLTNNPKIAIPITTTGRILEVVGILIVIASWFYTVSHYSKLPDIIPTHFGAGGKVDGYGGKMTILFLPLVGTILYVFMTIVARYPHKMNYLVTITEANARKQYSIVTSMFRILKISIAILFFVIAFETVQVAMGAADVLGKWFILILLGLVFVPLFYFMILSSKNA